MKKHHVLAGLMALLIMSASVVPAQAQTNEATARLAALMGQIQLLQAQLAELQARMTPATATGIEIRSTLQIGSNSEEVRELQRLLAKDPTLYPEGVITGYFGPMTAEAVKRLQVKFGLEAVGVVGPLTRERIKQWRQQLGENAMTSTSGVPPTLPPIDTSSVESLIDSLLSDVEFENSDRGEDTMGDDAEIDMVEL